MFVYKTSITTPYCNNQYFLSSKYCLYLGQEAIARKEDFYNCNLPSLLKENMSWVVLSAKLNYICRPYWKTDLILETYSFEPMGRGVPRRVVCKSTEGKLFFVIDYMYGIVSVGKNNEHKLIEPRVVTDRSEYDLRQEGDTTERFRKFNIDEYGKSTEIKHQVLFTDCDMNGHMNNLKYASWIISSLPPKYFEKGLDVKSIDICYSSELHLGDIANIRYVESKEMEYHICIGNAAFSKVVLGDVIYYQGN